MKKHEIRVLDTDCQIFVGESIKNLRSCLKSKKNVIITDANVRRYYGHHFEEFECIEIGLGEANKTLITVERIYRKFLELEVDRSSFVIGIGGGIVCDVAAYAATTYRSGIDYGFVPTTLLAQVDASLGGKNGVNFEGYKNIVGAFGQPRFILTDPDLLQTLPEKEFLSGLAEVVKYAVIRSPSLFEYLEQEWPALLRLQKEALEKIINESVVIKSWIVQSDAFKKGERRKLKFGHTLGQAIEREAPLSHGEAISIGMATASRISAARGVLSAEEADCLIQLLKHMKLPTEITSHKGFLLDSIKKEKKRCGANIHYVLLTKIGRAEVIQLPYSELEDHIQTLC